MRFIREYFALGFAIIVWTAGLAATGLIMLIAIGLQIHDHPAEDELAGLGYYLLGGVILLFVAVPFWLLPAKAVYRRLRRDPERGG